MGQSLDEEETRRLIAAYQAGDSEAAQRLIQGHRGLIHRIARRYKKTGGNTGEDIWQEGLVGLLDAAKKFDLARDNKFCTYASWLIWGRIQRSCQRMPDLMQERSPRQWHGDQNPFLDYVQQEERPADMSADEHRLEAADLIFWAMQTVLDETEQQVLELTFGLEDSIQRSAPEVSQLLGISGRRIVTIRSVALEKIRAAYRQQISA